LELDLAYPHFGGAALIAGGSALLEQAAESWNRCCSAYGCLLNFQENRLLKPTYLSFLSCWGTAAVLCIMCTVCTVHIICWEENRMFWRGNKLVLCSLGFYLTLTSRMLETPCCPNTFHFEMYTLAMWRPLGLCLSFVTTYSVCHLMKCELGGMAGWDTGTKAAFESLLAKSQYLSPLHCDSEFTVYCHHLK
jgi:hypothetical protein